MAKIDPKQAFGFLFAGALVGAAITLLYAPKSVRTAEDIKTVARKAMERLDVLQGAIRDQAADCVNHLTEIVKNGVDRGETFAAEGYEEVLQGLDNAKKCLEDGRNRIEQLIKRA